MIDGGVDNKVNLNKEVKQHNKPGTDRLGIMKFERYQEDTQIGDGQGHHM